MSWSCVLKVGMYWSNADPEFLMRISGEEVEDRTYQWFEVDSTTTQATEVEGWASVQRKCGEEASELSNELSLWHKHSQFVHLVQTSQEILQ